MSGALDVLMFGWEFPPYNTGGMGVACYGLTKGLSNVGVNVSFALPRRLKNNVQFMKILSHKLQGVQVTAINALLEAYQSATGYSTENGPFLDSFYGPTLYDEAYRFANMASSWSKTVPHNIIHAHDWMTYPAGIKAKQISGQPLVTHVHATEFDRTGGSVDSRIADVEYQGYQASDAIISVSNYTKDIINKYYGIPNHKITVVHNGVDPVEFSGADIRKIFPHDKVVLYVGRLTYQKGVDHFLRTAQAVLSTHPNTIFLVVGAGDMYRQLIMDAAYMGIAHRVIFTGFLTGVRLKSIYHLADVLLMPSISEPYGLVALEAVASHVPIIITKQSGVAETLPHAAIVDFWDVNKMARLVREVLDYPQLAREQALAVYQEMRQCTWDKAAQKTKALYQSLLT